MRSLCRRHQLNLQPVRAGRFSLQAMDFHRPVPFKEYIYEIDIVSEFKSKIVSNNLVKSVSYLIELHAIPRVSARDTPSPSARDTPS